MFKLHVCGHRTQILPPPIVLIYYKPHALSGVYKHCDLS